MGTVRSAALEYDSEESSSAIRAEVWRRPVKMGTIAWGLRFGPLAPLYERYTVARWERQGRPAPPPYTVKRWMILEFATRFGCRTLVETGTFRGDTPWSLRRKFDRVYSIELDRALYAAAVDRFAGVSNVTLIQGDSGERLEELVPTLGAKAIFWLDGHYSGPGTAIGVEEAPVMKELRTIFEHEIKGHIVLLDDARLFVGRAGYPSVDELRAWVQARRPDWTVEVVHDVIRVYPGVG
jgi:hypothetical protein